MRRSGRHMRGVVVIGMVRALRKWMRHTGAASVPGLEPADLNLLTTELVEPDPWYPYDQYLRLMQASWSILCRGDYSMLREFCSQGVAPVYGLGYQRLRYRDDPGRTMNAVSVMWRSCHDFGSAFATTDTEGCTIHVIGYPDVGELDGHVNVGWFMGMARAGGAELTSVELRGCPWIDNTEEQIVRLGWRLPATHPEPPQPEDGAARAPESQGRRLAQVG